MPVLNVVWVSDFSRALIPPEKDRPLVFGFVYPPKNRAPARVIGYYVQDNDDDPTGPVAALEVEDDDPKHPWLKYPVGYQNIATINNWSLLDNPVPSYYLAAWAPIAPQGYVPLGHVATLESETTIHPKPPSVNKVMCLRSDQASQVASDDMDELWSFDGDNYVYRVKETKVLAVAKGSSYPEIWIPKNGF